MKHERIRIEAENLVEGKPITIVGEAPGENETLSGRPFVGWAGRYQDNVLRAVGLRREDCCLTNLSDMRPGPNSNEFGLLYEDALRRRPTEELLVQVERCKREIRRVNSNVVVLAGNEPLKLLGGKKGILKWRGSILWSSILKRKVIPVLHPSAITRDWRMRITSTVDYGRVKDESKSPDAWKDDREIYVIRDYSDALGILSDMILERKPVSFDIETIGQFRVTHMGLSNKNKIGFSIPFWEPERGNIYSQIEEYQIWCWIKDLLEDPRVPKIAQNAQYDVTFIKHTLGIDVHPLSFDTMLAQHCLYPEMPKDLGFLCSMYIDVNYYKDEIKSNDPDAFASYNAKDACVTREIAVELQTLLRQESLQDFYYSFMHSLLHPLINIQLRGVLVDKEKQKHLNFVMETKKNELLEKIQSSCGKEVNPNSPKQVKEFLYDILKLPKKYKRGTRSLTTDKNALLELYEKTKNPVLRNFIEYRHVVKMQSTYINARLRKGRMHTSYNIAASTEMKEGTRSYEKSKSAPVTGRLSSSRDIFGDGTNLQNIPKGDSIRDMFIPDVGYIMCSVDLSQAEAIVTAYIGNDSKLIKMHEEDKKVHQFVASVVFGKSYDDVGKGTPEYELGKRLVHGTNYGMEAKTFSIYANCTVGEAQYYLSIYFREFPGIRGYHRTVESIIASGDPPTIITPLGRRRQFYDHPSNKMVKEALAFAPQSTIADLLNQIGIVRMQFLIEKREIDAQLLMQIHDEIVLQCRPDDREEVIKLLEEAFNYTFDVGGKQCKINYEYHFGSCLGDL